MRKLPGVVTAEALGQIRLRYEKEGPAALAAEFNLSPGAVRKNANRLGLKTKAGHLLRHRARAENNRSVDLTYFDRWSPNMAYTLGMLFADGNVNQRGTSLSMRLHVKDEDIVLKIREDMKSKTKLYYREAGEAYGRNVGANVTLVISSTVLVEKLKTRFGLLPAKSFRDDPMPDVPPALVPHVARGYFDGDGSVGITKRDRPFFSLVGTERFLLRLRDEIARGAGVPPHAVSRNAYSAGYRFTAWQTWEQLGKIFQWLYPTNSCELYGNRKHARFQEVLSRRPQPTTSHG